MEVGNNRFDTTLGELIAAASEVAFEYSDNEKEAYNLARLTLIELLKTASYAAVGQHKRVQILAGKRHLN